MVKPIYRVTKCGNEFGTYNSYDMATLALFVDARNSQTPVTEYKVYTVTK